MNGTYWARVSERRLTRRRAMAVAGAVVTSSAIIAACGGDDGGGRSGDTSGLLSKPVDTSKQAKKGGVLLSSRDRDIGSADPHFTTRVAPGSGFMYSRLFRRKPGYLAPQPVEFIGDLAESFEYSGDKQQLTVKLRTNAKWHNIPPLNGRNVDAQDIVYAWNRVATVSANRKLLSNAASPFGPIESMTAVDNRTVVIKTAFPAAGLLALLSGTISGYLWIIPRESESQYDLRTTPIGSGQWKVDKITPSVGIVFKRHEGWYDTDHVYIDEIQQPVVTEYATGLAQFRAGSIYDFEVKAADVIATKKDLPAIQIFLQDPPANGNIAFFGWNPAYGQATPFRDRRLRQAFSMSWDRDLWIDSVYEVDKFRAEGLPMESAWNSSILSVWPGWWLNPKGKELGPNAKYYQYNLEEAKKLVAAAGYASGVDIKAQYVTTGEYGADFNTRVETLMNFGRAAGLNLRTVAVGFNTDWRPKVADALGDFEGISFRAGAAGTQIADVGEGAFAYYHYQGGVNYTGFFSDNSSFKKGDPRINDLLEKTRAEFDEKKRMSLMWDVQRIMAEEQYMLHFPGSANTFATSWPVMGNNQVFSGELSGVNVWLDQTKPPIAKT